MAIAYPFAVPATLVLSGLQIKPRTNVGIHSSPFTAQQQTTVWTGQWWELSGTIPPRPNNAANGDAIAAFFLALNGVQGTFRFGDPSRTTTRGTAAGACTCAGGNVANSTTLLTAMTFGTFALGDWLQIGNFLHKIIQVNSASNYDVWPRLRTAYAGGTAITYTDPKGLFRLKDNEAMDWALSTDKKYGFKLEAMEALT